MAVAAIGERDQDQQQGRPRPAATLSDALPSRLLGHRPHEHHSQCHQHVPERAPTAGRDGVLRVHHQHADDDERRRARDGRGAEPPLLPGPGAAAPPSANGIAIPTMNRNAGNTRSVIVIPSSLGPLWRRKPGAPATPASSLTNSISSTSRPRRRSIDRILATLRTSPLRSKGNTIDGTRNGDSWSAGPSSSCSRPRRSQRRRTPTPAWTVRRRPPIRVVTRFAPATVPGMPGAVSGRVVRARSQGALGRGWRRRRRGRGARDDGARHAGAHR